MEEVTKAGRFRIGGGHGGRELLLGWVGGRALISVEDAGEIMGFWAG